MKKTLRNLFMLTAMSGLVFTACTKDETKTTTEPAAPTLTVNDGNSKDNRSSAVDSIGIKVAAQADTDRKITKLTITRAVTGQATNTIVSRSNNQQVLNYQHYDVIAGVINVDDGDVITYNITVEDDKGKTATGTYTVNINSMASSDQILLGAPGNSDNEYKFFGMSDNFKRYKIGTGTDAAKTNSEKIDIVYFFSTSGATGNAIYSPSYFKTAGVGGWETEISSWTKVNTTKLKETTLTASEFDALLGSSFLTELMNVDFTTGTVERIPNIAKDKVYAFQNEAGKRGFILCGQTSSSNTTGVAVFKVKVEL